MRLVRRGHARGAPKDVVADLHAKVTELTADPKSGADMDQVALAFGCLWGQMVVEEMGWEWASVSWGRGSCHAVVSPDRSVMVAPIRLFQEYLTLSGRSDTSLLLFNMLKAKRVPPADPGEYRLLD